MPRDWHDRYAVNRIEDEDKREEYATIVADRKPYFMRYIYPSLLKQYNTFVKNTNRNALREFRMTVDELYAIPEEDRSQRQSEFLSFYERRIPVSNYNSVMNRICRKVESEFYGYIKRHAGSKFFDYTILKNEKAYTQEQKNSVTRLYKIYNQELINYSIYANREKIDKSESNLTLSNLNDEFLKECSSVCPDEKVLCNILLDLCYNKSSTKRFVWSMCGNVIIDTLLDKHNNIISYMAKDDDGDVKYGGYRFSEIELTLEDVYEYSVE